MREISKEEHRLMLDLFVIAWFGWPMPKNENQYKLISDEWSLMNRLKDAFPMYEICDLFTYLQKGKYVYESVYRISEVLGLYMEKKNEL